MTRVSIQNCSFYNNTSSVSSDEKWSTLLRTVTMIKHKLDTPLHSLIKCLMILQLFTLFLICNLWFLRRGFQDTVELTPCFWQFKKYAMYITFSIWHELSLLILNIVSVAKHLMAVTSPTKLFQESHFFLQLLYPCFVLSRRFFLMLYGSLLSNKSFRLFSLLFPTTILFSGDNPFKSCYFVVNENCPWFF